MRDHELHSASLSIRLENIAVRRSEKDVLHGLSFDTRQRRIAIVGRNGSGKTTLARVLAGLQPCDSGCAEIGGADIAHDRKAALRSIGIIFQNPDHQIIFPTVEEEIGFGLGQLGLSKAEAARETQAILERFGKSDWAKAATHALSQGQKKLVCLMSVLAMRPSVIVLDEPYAALDIPTRMQLMRYVDALEASIIQITHDPDTVRHFDQVIWIDAGRIRMEGAAAEVLAAFEAQMQIWGSGNDLTHLAR